MVLISIHPFGLRKIFLIVVTLLCLSAFCFADSLFMARRYRPAGEAVSIHQAMPRDVEGIAVGHEFIAWPEIGTAAVMPERAGPEPRAELGLDATSSTQLFSRRSCVYRAGILTTRAGETSHL
jgi:hypothetical protein